MRIKEVEALVGISKKNIRFYEKEGLLKPGREIENSYRDYSDEDVLRLKQIKLLRKLSLPIGEIRSVFDGRTSVAAAAKRHTVTLAEQRASLQKSFEVCEAIVSDGRQLSELDVDAYLSGLEKMEKEGTVFLNIMKNDVKRRYVGALIGCAIVVAVILAMIVLLAFLNRIDPAPTGVLVFFYIVFAVVIVGTVAALIARIKEIRKGEENDLSNY